MAQYITAAELRRRSGIAGNLNISTTSVTTKTTIASGVVNGFVGSVYTLPLAEVPEVIKELTGAVAEALILKEEYGPEVADEDKDGFKKWDAAIDTLELIQKRGMKLFSDTTGLQLVRASFALPKSFPDATSDQLTTTASTAPVVRMGDQF